MAKLINLKKLNFFNNKIKAKRAKAIVLGNFSKLEELNLSFFNQSLKIHWININFDFYIFIIVQIYFG